MTVGRDVTLSDGRAGDGVTGGDSYSGYIDLENGLAMSVGRHLRQNGQQAGNSIGGGSGTRPPSGPDLTSPGLTHGLPSVVQAAFARRRPTRRSAPPPLSRLRFTSRAQRSRSAAIGRWPCAAAVTDWEATEATPGATPPSPVPPPPPKLKIHLVAICSREHRLQRTKG